MLLTPKIEQAVIKASQLHQRQKRKGDPAIPYIIHPFCVAFILSHYTDDEDIIIAGLLHDVIEDTSYTYKELAKDFGIKIKNIVKEVSGSNMKGGKKATWQKRKEDYLKYLKDASFEAMMVSCADKMHNLMAVEPAYKKYGKELWDRFNAPVEKKFWFYGEVLKILKQRLNNQIVKELGKIYKEARKISGLH